MTMLYELRYYYIQSGQMPEFVEIMQSLVIPFQLSQGMLVLGSFLDIDNEDCYVWLRRYQDETDKQRLYDRVYGSDYWENVIRPKIAGMILKEKTQVTLLKPCPGSILQ